MYATTTTKKHTTDPSRCEYVKKQLQVLYIHTASLTTLVLAVQSLQVDCTEVQALANDVVESWDGRGDGGDAGVLIKGEGAVVHDGLIIVRRVQVRDKVILIFVKIVLLPW